MDPELAKALVDFRSKVKTVAFDSQNPHFKSRFASLAAIHKSVDPILADCGLTVIQDPINPPEGHGVGVKTTLVHETGQTHESTFFLPTMKDDPQSAGSSVTYARRYALSGALGLVTDEDEDGEGATGRRSSVEKPTQRKPAREKSRKAPAMSKENRDALKAAIDKHIGLNGTPDTDQGEGLAFVAKALGHASPIMILDSEFEKALEALSGWKPEGVSE